MFGGELGIGAVDIDKKRRAGQDVFAVKKRRPKMKPSMGTAANVMRFKSSLKKMVVYPFRCWLACQTARPRSARARWRL